MIQEPHGHEELTPPPGAPPAPARRGGELRERDAMVCRSCGNEERASEGYPCASCGTFVCLMCVFKGVVYCATCAEATAPPESTSRPPTPRLDWPEH